MSPVRVSPFSSYQPDEHYSIKPVECVVCDREWDADEDGDSYKRHEDTDEVVCRGRCYDILNDRLEGELGDQDFTLEEAA